MDDKPEEGRQYLVTSGESWGLAVCKDGEFRTGGFPIVGVTEFRLLPKPKKVKPLRKSHTGRGKSATVFMDRSNGGALSDVHDIEIARMEDAGELAPFN